MASITPCCTSQSELPARHFWRRLLSAAALVGASLCAGPLQAAQHGIELRHADLLSDDDGYYLDAEFSLELPSALEDLVARGITLYFVMEVEIIRERRYWFDRVAAERRQQIRLSYYPITGSYRLSAGSLHQSFVSLDSALRSLTRVRNWRIAEKYALRPNKDYLVALRLELDRSQLPKPFQLSVLASDAWALSSGWQRWPFGPASREPVR